MRSDHQPGAVRHQLRLAAVHAGRWVDADLLDDGRIELCTRQFLYARGLRRLPDQYLGRILGGADRSRRCCCSSLAPLVERWGLRRVHKWGHVPELLFTFGLSYIIVELVQVIWGRAAVGYRVPPELDGPVDWLQRYGITFPEYRMFMMAVAIGMLVAIWLVLTRTRIGLVIQAALTHPQQVEALGHNVPRVFMLVFGGGSRACRTGGSRRRQCVCHRAGDGRNGRRDRIRRDRGGRHGLARRCVHCFVGDRTARKLRQGIGLRRLRSLPTRSA